MKNIIILGSFIFGALACSVNPSDENLKTADLKTEHEVSLEQSDFPIGTKYSLSEVAVQGAYNQLKQNLKKNEAISIVAEVDHSKNAKSVGLDLDYTKIIFFGNPQLGTPLMQENQLAGLDLPQKILFYEDNEKNDIILYNSVAYLKSRHGLEGVPTLDKISGALENLVSEVSKNEVLASSEQIVGLEEGIITKSSDLTFEETYSNLKTTLNEIAAISIMAELDHQKNAESVGLELNPTRIIIFGNPNLGTPLMQQEQSIGLDLPQKMLVWENEEGEVFVSYNDPFFIAERHDITENEEILTKISGALENISESAISN